MKVALVVLFGKEKNMGYFTWTDARREPKVLKNGRFSSRDILGYDLKERLSGSENRIAISECL